MSVHAAWPSSAIYFKITLNVFLALLVLTQCKHANNHWMFIVVLIFKFAITSVKNFHLTNWLSSIICIKIFIWKSLWFPELNIFKSLNWTEGGCLTYRVVLYQSRLFLQIHANCYEEERLKIYPPPTQDSIKLLFPLYTIHV